MQRFVKMPFQVWHLIFSAAFLALGLLLPLDWSVAEPSMGKPAKSAYIVLFIIAIAKFFIIYLISMIDTRKISLFNHVPLSDKYTEIIWLYTLSFLRIPFLCAFEGLTIAVVAFTYLNISDSQTPEVYYYSTLVMFFLHGFYAIYGLKCIQKGSLKIQKSEELIIS